MALFLGARESIHDVLSIFTIILTKFEIIRQRIERTDYFEVIVALASVSASHAWHRDWSD